jgi:subtilisin family serine protease
MSVASHRSYALCTVVAAVALLCGCAEIAQHGDESLALPKQLRSRQVVVTLAKGEAQSSQATAQALASRYRLLPAGSFPLDTIDVQCVVFDIPPERSVDQVIDELRSDWRVESVQMNSLFDSAQKPHDDPYGKLEYGARTIHADAAHRVSTGKGIRVAVVDTGVDTDHPDLRGRVAEIANFVDGGDSSFATDRHGTAVAGVIGARADNAVGVFGIAPEADLIVAKACWYADRSSGKARCSSWTLAKAIDFAIREHSQVLNLSLKGPDDALLERLLVAAEGRGIVVVAAASEDEKGPGFPAASPIAIAVIASDNHGDIKPRVWLEHKFAIAAPGVDILTTVPKGGYDFVSGSSFSAAEVSGVVALLLERRPGIAPREVREVLQRSAHPLIASADGATRVQSGLVDACSALSALLGSSACP